MPTYKHEVPQRIWDSLKSKAERLRTTPELLLDVRVREFCEAIHSEVTNERRSAIISRIVDLPETQLDDVDRVLTRVAK